MTETYKKKLIEVPLPLESINHQSAMEKGSPLLKGHPRNMNPWRARRLPAACPDSFLRSRRRQVSPNYLFCDKQDYAADKPR